MKLKSDKVAAYIKHLSIKDLNKPVLKIFKSKFKKITIVVKNDKNAISITEDELQERYKDWVWMIVKAFKAKYYLLLGIKHLQQNDYLEAWHDFVDAEKGFEDILRLFSVNEWGFLNIDKLLKITTGYMQLINYTGRLIFTSIGMKVIDYQCSICGKKYGKMASCGHYYDKFYNGEICYKRINEFDWEEQSLVYRPRNKHCIMQKINGEHFNQHFDFSHVDFFVENTPNVLIDFIIYESRKKLNLRVNPCTIYGDKIPLDHFKNIGFNGQFKAMEVDKIKPGKLVLEMTIWREYRL